MPSLKSPYATSFKSAIQRGTPAGLAVAAIAKKSGKNPQQIFTSLFKAQLCQRQKLNGQWIYWPIEGFKRSATQAKNSQIQMWQHFVDWCIASGNCKPEQLERNIGSQASFMSYCRKFFNRQITGGSTSSVSTSKPKRRKTSVRRSSSYKFPRTTSKTTQRRYRKAA